MIKKITTFICVLILLVQIPIEASAKDEQKITGEAAYDYSAVFDAAYYAARYSDLNILYGNDVEALLCHFITYGMDEGRQGNADFNVYIYMNNYEDLQRVFGNNLKLYYMHYVSNGKSEGRIANRPVNETDTISRPPVETEIPKKNTVTISIAGDCTLGEYKGQGASGQFKDYYNQYGPAYFFSNVQGVFANDDITFVNLEGPITNYEQVAVKTYPIKGDARNINCLTTSSIEVVNLSNNHIYDCGNSGFEETKQILANAGIGYCGESNIYTTKVNGITVSFFGYQGWSNSTALRNQIQADLLNSKSNIKIVEFHWGTERDYIHNSTQEALAHFTIDAGADMVVGAHPHVLQDVEMYNNKLICYSLGNFSFGANKNPGDKDTCIVSVTFNAAGMINYEFIPCKISSVNNCNDYKPTITNDPAEVSRIQRKLRL